MAKKKILVVDYEPKSLDRLVEMLADGDYEVEKARDGVAALERFGEFEPDLVLLRTMLPKKHGFQVCQEMVEASGPKHVPIVMHCSIYKSKKYRNDALKIYGASEYLEDPIDKATLNEVLSHHLSASAKDDSAASEKADASNPAPKDKDGAPASKGKNSGSFDIDKVLEDTLSGLQTGTRKGGSGAGKPAGEAKAPPKTKAGEEPETLTSEELFSDVIQDVEKQAEAPKDTAKEVEPPKPEQAPPASKTPSQGVEDLIGKDLIESRGPSSTSRKPKDKSDRELNKKLEATLSGINLKSRKEEKGSAPAAAKPKEQAAPPVEEKRTPSAEPEQGTPYGNYLLTERVAVGGMAELFKARQKGLEGFQRIVAIKRILPHLASNSDFVTMFIDEAKLAAQLNHPNIVHIYDLGRLEDSYFIAMEYVDGKDLRAVLREVENRGKTFPAKAVVFLALKLCAALHCAHTAKDMDGRPMNLVHRDVSPQNILISTAGEVKLVDFGIAKAATKASHTQSGALKGKLLYMSPEQAWGKPIDARTDIFSTGTVLYEMLTGRKLFQGSSEMSILESVREAVLPDLSGMRNFIPEGLDAILSKALKQDPGERYRDCRSFSHDLEKFAIQQWGSLPTAYDVLAFMTALFPKIYKPEALEALGAEERREEAGVIGDGPADEMVTPAAEESHPKMKAPPVKPAAPPAEVPPPKPPPPAKPAVKPPPPSSKPPTGEEDHGMFKEVMEGSSGGGKKIALIGGIAAVIIAAVLVGLFVMKHSGPAQASPAQGAKNGPAAAAAAGPSPRPAAQPENSTSGASNALPANSPAAQAGEGAATRPAPAAAKASEKAAAAKAAQADRLRKARENAASQIKRFDSAMTEAKAVGASKYAASAMGALNNTKSNIDKLFKSAGSLDDYNLVAKTAREGVVLAGQVKQQALNAKASAQKKQQEEAAAKEAKKQAPEVPKTTAAQGEAPESAKPAAAKSEEKAAPAKPAPPKLKPGDFVPLWKVDVKPKIIKRALPRYSALARQHNVQGTIYVQVTINQTGKATEAKIVKGLKNDFGMNDACLAAALKSRYSPAIKNGIPVTTNLTYSIVLKIE